MKYTHATKDGKLAREIARIDNKTRQEYLLSKNPAEMRVL